MRLIASVALCMASAVSQAHEVRPGYLEVREVGEERFEVLWKVPALGDNYRLRIHAVMPDSCEGAPSQGSFVGTAFVERWHATCPGGLVGKKIEVSGLSATRTDVLARVERLGVESHLGVVRLAAPRVAIFWPVVCEQTERGCRQALHQAVEQGLRLVIDPVQILEDH
jgi:hypothetical protein